MRIRMRGLLLVAAAGLGLALVAPTDARAGGDHFENGFKDELGRVAAHEAFGIGRHILAEVLLGGGHYGHGYRRPIHHRTYYRHGYYDDYDRHDRHYYRHKRHHYRHYKHHKRHHRRHHGHYRRGHYHDCDD